MKTNTVAAPAGLRLARWYLAAVAALLLGIAALTIASYVAAALTGTTLVFSQEEMDAEPALVIPADEATGATQFVDLPSLALTTAAGAVAALGAGALFRRGRLALPLGIAAAVVTAGVGLLPAILGLWAVNYYALVDLASASPLLIISAALVLASVLSGLAVWRSRRVLSPG